MPHSRYLADLPLDQRWFEDYVVGTIVDVGEVEFTEADIIAYALRFDPQYIHIDPVRAKDGPFGGLIASGFHTLAGSMRLFVDKYLSSVAAIASPGIDAMRFHLPVRPGDRLRLRIEVMESRRSASKPDRGIMRNHVDVLNQNHEVVLSHEPMNMLFCRPGERAV